MKQLLQFFWHLSRNIAIATVWLYQKTLSLDHGPLRHLYPYGYCRHHPTCSAYSIQQLRRGFVVGSYKSALRILRCTPWSKVSTEKILKTSEHL